MKILAFPGFAKSVNSVRPEAEIFIGLVAMGHQVTVMLPPDSNYIERYKECGVKLVYGYPKRKICFETIKTLRQELKEHDYDIVFATNSRTIPNAAFACFGLPVKLVAYRGTTGGLYRHDPTAYLTLLNPRLDGVICVSEAVREDVLKQIWKGHDKVVAIHKGHELAWYDKPAADLTEFGIKEGDFVAICACNVRPSKGIPVMLEATKQLAELDNFHLLLVGMGLDSDFYRDLIEQSAMKERIHVTGYRMDAPELITASDVLVQPSISGEGLPRAVMEAMAYGTPSIITTTGGGREVIVDGETGFIVPIKDANAIVAKIKHLYNEPQLVKSMGEQGRERLQSHFSCSITVDKFSKFFQSLIE